METPPPTLFHGGRIFTGAHYQDALLLEEGRVLAIGDRAALERRAASGVERVDLRGRLVLPGLTDHHLHVAESVRARAGVSLWNSRSGAEIEDRLRHWVERNPSGPVWGGGWDQERLPPEGVPDRAGLDRVVGDRPVLLDRVCLHVAAVNSAALAVAGVDRSTPDPPGGAIGRDRDGEPNGLLYDSAIETLRPLRQRIFRERAAETRVLLATWARWGLARAHAMSIDAEEARALASLEAQERLPIDLSGYLRLLGWSPNARRDFPAARPGFELSGVKVHLDGSLGARTAWLSEPYAGRPNEVGTPLWERESLVARLQGPAVDGQTIALHAIGDSALELALSSIRALPPGTSARIEHASVASPELRQRLARARVPVIVQPLFRESDSWIEARLGAARIGWAYAFRSLVESGVTLYGSSDAPVESPDPWAGMRAAAHASLAALEPGSLTPTESVQLYVAGVPPSGADAGAFARLRPGEPGDLVVTTAPDIERLLAGPGVPVAGVWHAGIRTA
jgi:predicted amidohydrolase YtcJ